jgi:outer membrane protein assembly factor BamA
VQRDLIKKTLVKKTMTRCIASLMLCAVYNLSPPGETKAAAQASLPIARVKVEGNSRFTAEAVVTASGVRVGQSATPSDFETASKRLLDSGMFQSASYRYAVTQDPNVKGYDLTIQIAEVSYLQPVKLDIPDVDEAALWAWLERHDPLLLRKTPSNEKAFGRYTAAIKQYLKEQNREQELVTKVEQDLYSHEMTIFIRPKVLPIVREIRFEGIQAASHDAVLKPMARQALGSPYTEYNFRALLELNVRPVYEELGCLAVQFPKIQTDQNPAGDGVIVTVTVDEGVVYHLSKVNLSAGEFETSDLMKAAQFPVGKIANWKQITESVANMAKLFQSNGYLGVTSKLHRNLDAASHNLILDINVESRKQSYFGNLILQGLEPSFEGRARSLWKLERGLPMDLLYLDDYKRKVFDERAAGNRKTVTQELKARPGTDLVDVILTFR